MISRIPSICNLRDLQHDCARQVMWAAFREGSLDPAEAASLELHGTGTALGDPIELGAAAAVQGARHAGACLVPITAFPSHACARAVATSCACSSLTSEGEGASASLSAAMSWVVCLKCCVSSACAS